MIFMCNFIIYKLRGSLFINFVDHYLLISWIIIYQFRGIYLLIYLYLLIKFCNIYWLNFLLVKNLYYGLNHYIIFTGVSI